MKKRKIAACIGVCVILVAVLFTFTAGKSIIVKHLVTADLTYSKDLSEKEVEYQKDIYNIDPTGKKAVDCELKIKNKTPFKLKDIKINFDYNKAESNGIEIASMDNLIVDGTLDIAPFIDYETHYTFFIDEETSEAELQKIFSDKIFDLTFVVLGKKYKI